ncbi:hypothetical protein ACGFJC_47105 [Nonomuraea fuscirosea]|uniref:hypothetical protein n=1 Tax=Nonomuraea fuscirosea TaxID=1291556 RepID=UPI0037202350
MTSDSGPGPEAVEDLTLAGGDMHAERCPSCDTDDTLARSAMFALTSDGVIRVGDLAVCLVCHWSPYT